MSKLPRGSEIVTPAATLCFSYLTRPDQKGRFRAELVFSKYLDARDTRLFQGLEDASAALRKEAFGAKVKGAKSGILGPDDVTTDDDLHNECLAILRPWSTGRNGEPNIAFYKSPEISKGKQLDLSAVEELFYDGCQVRAAVVPFAFENEGNRGISWFLNALVFLSDGPRISSAPDSGANLAAAMGIEVEEEEDAVESLLG